MSHLTWAKWEWDRNIRECEQVGRNKVEVNDASLSIIFLYSIDLQSNDNISKTQKVDKELKSIRMWGNARWNTNS